MNVGRTAIVGADPRPSGGPHAHTWRASTHTGGTDTDAAAHGNAGPHAGDHTGLDGARGQQRPHRKTHHPQQRTHHGRTIAANILAPAGCGCHS